MPQCNPPLTQGPNNGHIPPATLNTDISVDDQSPYYGTEGALSPYSGTEGALSPYYGTEGALTPYGWEKTAALRSGDWKVVWHQVEAPCHGSMANASGQNCLHRATGWVKLEQDAKGDFDCRSYEMPTAEQSCDETPCLFDLKNGGWVGVLVYACMC